MPKFEVTILNTRAEVYLLDAVNAEEAAKIAMDMEPGDALRHEFRERVVDRSHRRLDGRELVFKFQIENIRRDYDILQTNQKLPSGEIVDDATAETMKSHLITLHDNLVEQSGLDIPKLGEPGNLIAEHLGEDEWARAIAEKKPVDSELERLKEEAPQVIWERCAAAFGWEWDADYKGWIKRANIKPGAIHGEWDAYVRDQTAEDACNEEGIDSVEEAAEALS